MRFLASLCVAALAVSGCGGKQAPADPPPAPSTPRPTEIATPQYPIVLAHGILAGPQIAPFAGVRGALGAHGVEVYETRVDPVSALAVRAPMLGRQLDEILERSGAQKVNIIAHSMGGLDARWLISKGGYDAKVASLTTVSTPHRGSYHADVSKSIWGPNALNAASSVAATLNAHLFGLPKRADWNGMLADLSESNARAFNAEVHDIAGVHYQSFAGIATTLGAVGDVERLQCGSAWPPGSQLKAASAPQFGLSFDFASSKDGPFASDGVVSVESAKWGEFRGCIGADHMDQIGWYGNDDDSEFDHLAFYLSVVDDLAARGF